MTPLFRTFAIAAAALLAGHSLAAQSSRTGRIEGTVHDSLSAKPLAGAVVTVVQVSPAPQQFFTAITDGAGQYHVDSLVAGRFLVGFTTPFLDSLELQFPQKEVILAGAQQGRADFATPSRATLARAACPGIPLPKGRGAIVGQVMNAETDHPLGGATIAVSWTELGMNLKAMRPTSQERSGAVVTDSLGLFRVCNVPTDTYVVLQVQEKGRAGIPLRTTVADAAAVMVQNLSLSTSSSRAFAATDSVEVSTADTVVRLLSGTASVSGTVRGADGQPMADAHVRVVDAVGSARSDASGHYSLAGLPAGTQVLEVRHVGFLLGHQPVELRSGRASQADIRLSRIVTLDSVRIVAQRTRLHEFERRANAGSTGTFLTETQIAGLHVRDVGDIFRNGRTLGFKVVGEGIDAKVLSTRGLASLDLSCSANIVIDGMQHQDINLVAPSNIAAIEVYRGAGGAPPEYDSACGAVIIWTKR